MVLRIPKFNSYDKLFVLAFAIYMIFAILHTSFFAVYFLAISKYITLLCIGLLFLYEVLKGTNSKREVFGLFLLYFLALWLIWRGNRNYSFAVALLFAFSSRNIDFIKIAKVSVLISVSLLIFIVGCSQIGIIPDYIETAYSITGLRVRHFLGFRYSLYGPGILLNIILLYTYIRKEKIRYIEIGLLFAVNLLMFLATNGRLSFLVSVFSVIIVAINKFRRDNFSLSKVISRMMIPSYIFCCATILFLTLLYTPGNRWMFLLNLIMAGRLAYSQISIKLYGIHLFGSDIEWMGNGLDPLGKNPVGELAYLFVDSFYLQSLQKYGVIFTIVYLILLTYIMYIIYKKGDILLLLIFSLHAIYGTIDASNSFLHYNTFLLFIGIVLSGHFCKETDNRDNSSDSWSNKNQLNLIS